MLRKPQLQRNQEGFVLVVTLLIMVLLTIIGVAMNRSTTTELQIAGNDKVHKQTFTEADGGTEFAAEVLEQNIGCLIFSNTAGGGVTVADGFIILDGNIAVDDNSLDFWQNGIGHWSGASLPAYPADNQRDLWLPPNYAAGDPHTNITLEGSANFAEGSSIILAGGYLGLGRGMSSGGIHMNYEIHSQHLGQRSSESIIRVRWRHVVGSEDIECNY